VADATRRLLTNYECHLVLFSGMNELQVPGNLIAELILENGNWQITCDDTHSKFRRIPVDWSAGIHMDKLGTTKFGTTMSNKNNNSDSLFSNQDTIVRREWINSALDGVRSRLGSGQESDVIAGNIDGANIEANEAECASTLTGQAEEVAAAPAKRGLYVAWSSRERRSGT
jgi:hypothetical protein